jgi:hypothetical protein
MIWIRLLGAVLALLWLTGFQSPSSSNHTNLHSLLSVQVRDLLSKKPIAGASVRVQGLALLAVTDAQGRVSLPLKSLPEQLRVFASADGYMGASDLASPRTGKLFVLELPALKGLQAADALIKSPATRDPHRHQHRTPDHMAPDTTGTQTPIMTTYQVPTHITLNLGGGKTMRIGLEEYVKGVLPKEIGTSFPLESMKAQAVAARTYAVRYTQGGRRPICITTTCQVWSSKRYAITDKAVDETKSIVILHGGKIVEALFFASCGGRTINSEDRWNYAAHLRAKPCIENKGSACSVVCSPSQGKTSTCWGIYGHRVGLCQRGTQSMGKCGKKFDEILKHYYTGITLANFSSTPPPPKNDAKLVSETLKDGVKTSPNQRILKQWKLQNTGNTTWDDSKGYALLHLSGDRLGAQSKLAMGTKVGAGRTRDFVLSVTIPNNKIGTFESKWQLAQNGTRFGPVLSFKVIVEKPPVKCVDNDSDGFFAKQDGCPGPYDCNDKDKSVFPGGREICGNGKDDDCKDGDSTCPADCKDEDKDGYYAYGDKCQGPFDCNDKDKSIYPGAAEICGNGKDEDCQGGDLACTEPPKKKLGQGQKGCKNHNDCEEGLVCAAYKDTALCTRKCSAAASECPQGYECLQKVVCWPKTTTQPDGNTTSDAGSGKTCSSNKDCAPGDTCSQGRCERTKSTYCRSDADCSGQQSCKDGRCQPKQGCGCAVSTLPSPVSWLWLSLFLLWGFRRRSHRS